MYAKTGGFVRMNPAMRAPSSRASSAGELPGTSSPNASMARRMTKSSTARRSPAFERKWCWTRPGETPAALATSRIDVPATPRVANARSAASRMRAAPVRSEGAVAIRLY